MSTAQLGDISAIERGLARLFAAEAGEPGCEHELAGSWASDCPACFEARRVDAEIAHLWQSAPPVRPARRAWWVAAGALAAAALALFFLIPSPDAPRAPAPLLEKGGFQLHVGVDRQGEVLRLRSGDPLETGDRIGLFYSATTRGWVSVLYVTPSGELVWLHPAVESPAAPVGPGHEVRLLAGAVITPPEEGQPSCEWIVAVFSTERLDGPAAASVVREMLAKRPKSEGCALGGTTRPDVQTWTVEVSR